MAKTKCEACDRNFKNEEALAAHNSAKHVEPKKQENISKFNFKKIRNWSIFVIIFLAFGGILYLIFSNVQNLPPTDMDGHVEKNPPSHVLKEPMPLSIQKHMLEHVDGIDKGRGGIIINYNCKQFTCEEKLIEKLEAFAAEYDYVYVAPFKGMDVKIALTKLGKIQTFNDYDAQAIRAFITRY